MLVSHDRFLLRSVCDEFWLASRGAVEPFDSDLLTNDYQDEAKSARRAESLAQGQTRTGSCRSRQRRPEQEIFGQA